MLELYLHSPIVQLRDSVTFSFTEEKIFLLLTRCIYLFCVVLETNSGWSLQSTEVQNGDAVCDLSSRGSDLEKRCVLGSGVGIVWYIFSKVLDEPMSPSSGYNICDLGKRPH
jgi:hypothetical protein